MAAVVHAHTYVGLTTTVRARVQSPNASTADFPIPIAGTNLSIMCFKVRNSSTIDSRITAVGFDLPGTLSGFTLIAASVSDFHVIEQVSNVPLLPDVTLDFALVTGSTFGGGRPHAGLAPTTNPLDLTTFCVSGPFPQTTSIETLINDGVVRFQAIGDDDLGDIAVFPQ
jgi:hypothetical protein